MCRCECCSTTGKDAELSAAFREMDEWDGLADGISLFESYREPSGTGSQVN